MQSTKGIALHDCLQNLKYKSLTLSRATSSFYSCTTIKLIQMEYQVTYIFFPTFYLLTLNDWPLSGKCSMRGEVLKKGMWWMGKKKTNKNTRFSTVPLKVCLWLTEPLTVLLKTMWSLKKFQAPPAPLAIKWWVVAFITVCHSFPVILAFVSGLHFNTWSYSKLSSTR